MTVVTSTKTSWSATTASMSDTFDKEQQKRIARRFLKDADEGTIQKVRDEIDAAPTKTEREAAQAAEQQNAMNAALGVRIMSRAA